MEVQISPSCTKVQGGLLCRSGRSNDDVLFFVFFIRARCCLQRHSCREFAEKGYARRLPPPGWRTRPEAWNVQISPSCTKVQGIFRMGTATPEGIVFFLFGVRRHPVSKII